MNILSYLLLLVNMKKVYFYYTFFYFFFLNSTIAPLKSPIHVSILITFVLLHFLHPFSSAGSSALFSASPSVFPHLLHSFGLSYVASSQSCPNASICLPTSSTSLCFFTTCFFPSMWCFSFFPTSIAFFITFIIILMFTCFFFYFYLF